MAQEIYTERLKAQIGRVQASVSANNYFPLVGETVEMQATMRWARTADWLTQAGDGSTTTAAASIEKQKASQSIHVAAPGDLAQKLVCRNPLTETVVQKTIYAMLPQILPYFKVSASKEVIRADGEVSSLFVTPECGYLGSHSVVARIYRENEEINPVKTLTFDVGRPIPEGKIATFYFSNPSDRGIYDVEVDVTDSTTGVTFSQRHNKLITVTPQLAPEPADRTTGYRDIFATRCFTSYSGKDLIDFHIRLWENTGDGLHYAELSVPAGEQNGTCYYSAIDISVLPAGTTLVLKDDPLEPDKGYARRLLLKGNNPPSVSNANGTPNFTFEKPLIITINQTEAYHIPFKFYSGINFENNCRNILLDGRGYKNLSRGLHIHKVSKEEWGQTNLFLLNGTSDVELVELDMYGCDFTAIMAKTDPDPNRPWYWFGNWEFNNLLLHHCHIHDNEGEGFYIGYFTPETMKNTNQSGQLVTYRPHAITNARIYRNRFENIGYDGLQLSNARNAEVCYNELYNVAFRGEKDQASGISIQSMSGRCYNNVLRKYIGPALQIGPIGDLEVFNNIATDCSEGQPGIQFLFSVDTPEQNPSGEGFEDKMQVYIHNNVLMCNSVAVNGRNTTQVKGIYCTDNIFVYKDVRFGNMATDTISLWESQAKNNLWIDQKIIDFVAIDSYKIADSANGDFRIAADSPLIRSGSGDQFKFDFRGYKNWYGTVSCTGAYMGIYKSANVNDDPISLTSVTVNEGALSTQVSEVSVKMVYTGAPTRYRAGETADLSAVAWTEIPEGDTFHFILSDGFGVKTIYTQVGAGAAASEVEAVTIEYLPTPITLDALVLNDGKAISRNLTIPVAFTCSGSYPATHYRIAETTDLSMLDWQKIDAAATYTFADIGQKRLYGQVKDSLGNVSETKSATVEIDMAGRKIAVSTGYYNIEVPSYPGCKYEDSVNKINCNVVGSKPLLYNTEEVAGEALIKSGTIGGTNDGYKGAVTGDNSFDYLDDVMWHNLAYGGNSTFTKEIGFVLPAGNYRIRIFASTIYNRDVTPAYRYLFVSNAGMEQETVKQFVLQPNSIVNNTSKWTDWLEITIPDGGEFLIRWGLENPTAWSVAPLNIIEIEEV